MSHYLTYVYGPRNLHDLEKVMEPYSEHTRGGNPKWVYLKDVPVSFEMTLLELITNFAHLGEKKWTAPIVIVDENLCYEEMEELARISPVVIQYNLDVKQVTLNLIFNQDFWDWWQVGGRWPGQFHIPGRKGGDIVQGMELSWVWDKNKPDLKGRFNSVEIREVNWAEAMRTRIKQMLALWEIVNPLTQGMAPAWTMMGPAGERGVEDGPHWLILPDNFWPWHAAVNATEGLPKYDEGEKFGWARPSEVVGLTRHQVVRLAMARALVPAYALIQREWQPLQHPAKYMEKYPPEKPAVSYDSELLNMCWPGYPSPEYVDEVLRMIRALPLDTVVTAVDIHN